MVQASTAEQRERRETEKSDKPGLVVVDLGKRQSPKRIKQLRKGRGKLMRRIEEIVDELTTAGSVKAHAQPVVIVIRERTPWPWPFDTRVSDLDDDD